MPHSVPEPPCPLEYPRLTVVDQGILTLNGVEVPGGIEGSVYFIKVLKGPSLN